MTVPDARYPDRLPAAFTRPGSSSFVDFLRSYAPDLLPGGGPAPQSPVSTPHATTIVALTYGGGMVMAGDRRATAGSAIAHRQMQKVFPADEYSVIGIAEIGRASCRERAEGAVGAGRVDKMKEAVDVRDRD